MIPGGPALLQNELCENEPWQYGCNSLLVRLKAFMS